MVLISTFAKNDNNYQWHIDFLNKNQSNKFFIPFDYMLS